MFGVNILFAVPAVLHCSEEDDLHIDQRSPQTVRYVVPRNRGSIPRRGAVLQFIDRCWPPLLLEKDFQLAHHCQSGNVRNDDSRLLHTTRVIAKYITREVLNGQAKHVILA